MSRQDYRRGGATLHVQGKPLGAGRYAIVVGERRHEVTARALPDGRVWFELDGRAFVVAAAALGRRTQVRMDGRTFVLEPADGRMAPAIEGSGVVVAPMTGTVLKVMVRAGDPVEPGTTLVVLGAMKMEHKLAATIGGRVTELHAREGETVEQGTLLVQVQ